jgi:hypothetical protein
MLQLKNSRWLICGGKWGYLDGEASNVDGKAMWNWIREMYGQTT